MAESLTSLANGIRTQFGNEVVLSLVDAANSHLKDIVSPNSIVGRLRAKGRIFFGGLGADVGGSKAGLWPVYHSAGEAAWYAMGDPYPTATNLGIAQASEDWAHLWISQEINGTAAAGARGNSMFGDLSAVSRTAELKLKAMFSNLENSLVKAQSGNACNGVKTWMTNTGTFEGISLTNAYWQPALKDASAATVTLAMVREVLAQMSDNNASDFDEIWVSATQYNLLENILSGRIQYVDIDNGVEGLIRTFTIDGRPVIKIDAMEPSGNGVRDEIWFVNTMQMSLHFLPQNAPDSENQQTMADEYEGIPFGVKATDPGHDAEALIYKLYAQLLCHNPSKFGAIYGAATS